MARLMWLLTSLAATVAIAASAAPEYSIKAGYLLLFTRYVEWPANAFGSPDAPVELCILGADPFGSVLDKTIAGQQSQQRPLSARRIVDTNAAQECHVVFIGTTSTAQGSQWLGELSGRPVLTVTDQRELLKHGAVLSFVSEIESSRARIRFEAN